MTSVQMRYQGCLMGLAVGDALGTTLEFKPPGSFTPITDMNLPAPDPSNFFHGCYSGNTVPAQT